MFSGNNVIDVMGHKHSSFTNSAIFTTSAGAFIDKLVQ
jgi:hypothetical protein